MDVMNTPIAWLAWTGIHMSPWKLIGLTGALMFGARWLVQFLASRRARRPVIPRLFWVMSLVGSAMTLAYFLFSQKQDAVGVLQNLLPAFTAAYSLWLDVRHARRQHDVPLAPARNAVERNLAVYDDMPARQETRGTAMPMAMIMSSPPARAAAPGAPTGTAPAVPAR